MKITENGQTTKETNQATPESTTSKIVPTEKPFFSEVSIKELVAKPEVQEAIRHHIHVPEIVTVKKVRKSFENKETKTKTQKIEVMSGTTIEDAITFELVLVDTEIDPVAAINKKYRIVDYTVALDANMKERNFLGYAAKGLKVLVTKFEEVRGDVK